MSEIDRRATAHPPLAGGGPPRSLSRREVTGMLAAAPVTALAARRTTAPRDAGQGSWNVWRPVPGGLSTACAPGVAGIGGSDGQPCLVVRAPDGGVRYNRLTVTYSLGVTSLTWAGWREIPGGVRTTVSPCVVEWDDLDGGYALGVFVWDTGNRVQQNLYNPRSGAWRGWREVPGGSATLGSLAASWLGGNVILHVRDHDGGILENSMLFRGGHWTGWRAAIPGGMRTSSAPGSATGSTGNGQSALSVVVRGRDEGIWENVLSYPQFAWRDWAQVGGGGLTHSSPAASDTFDALRPPLVVRAVDNGVAYNARDPDVWYPVPGGQLTPSAPAVTDVSVYPANYRFVFVRGPDDGLHYNFLAR